ncbi:MAG: DUF5661 family protein [Thermomicrobiales bacterium]
MQQRITADEARGVGAQIGIDWETSPFDVEQFRAGMDVELEHGAHDPQTDVTGDDPILTGKIAWAHLKEFPDYYTRLEEMEKTAERYWEQAGC